MDVPPWRHPPITPTRLHTTVEPYLRLVRTGTNTAFLGLMPPCPNWGMPTILCAQHSSKLNSPHNWYACINDNLYCILLEPQIRAPSASHNACPLLKPPPSAERHCPPSGKEGEAHVKSGSCRDQATQQQHNALDRAWVQQLCTGRRPMHHNLPFRQGTCR